MFFRPRTRAIDVHEVRLLESMDMFIMKYRIMQNRGLRQDITQDIGHAAIIWASARKRIRFTTIKDFPAISTQICLSKKQKKARAFLN